MRFFNVVFNCVVTHASNPLSSVANRTVNQANVVGETAVAGANDMSQATVEGVENVAATTGMMNPVGGASQPSPDLLYRRKIIILLCSFSREPLGLEHQTLNTINNQEPTSVSARCFHTE